MALWDTPSLGKMERTLDVATFRQKVTANNIANAETPYFKRADVRFEELLAKELSEKKLEGRLTDSRHIPIGKGAKIITGPEVLIDSETQMNNNLNNVDMDYEMALLAKNQIRYNVLIGQVNHDLKLYRTAIGGGRA